MSLRTLLRQTVTVHAHTLGSVDEYNNPVESWVAGTSYPGRIELTTGNEANTDRSTQIGDYLLILFAQPAALSGRDRVVADGATYEVVGPPEVARTPRGVSHLEARLRAVTGV